MRLPHPRHRRPAAREAPDSAGLPQSQVVARLPSSSLRWQGPIVAHLVALDQSSSAPARFRERTALLSPTAHVPRAVISAAIELCLDEARPMKNSAASVRPQKIALLLRQCGKIVQAVNLDRHGDL